MRSAQSLLRERKERKAKWVCELSNGCALFLSYRDRFTETEAMKPSHIALLFTNL